MGKRATYTPQARLSLNGMHPFACYAPPCSLRFSRCRDKQAAFEAAFPIVDKK